MWQTSFDIYGQKLCIKVQLLSRKNFSYQKLKLTELGFLSWIYYPMYSGLDLFLKGAKYLPPI